LTPRGLSNTFSTNDMSEEFMQNHQLDSFLLSRRRDEETNKDVEMEEIKAGGEESKKQGQQ